MLLSSLLAHREYPGIELMSRRPDYRRRRSAIRRPPIRFRPLLAEPLVERHLLASFFVDEAADFQIDSDLAPSGLSSGDTVTWKPGTADETSGLLFDTNAFTALQDVHLPATSGDTIHIAPGQFSGIRTTKALTLDGAPETPGDVVIDGGTGVFGTIDFNHGGVMKGHVIIRDLTVNSGGVLRVGIAVGDASSVTIENVHVARDPSTTIGSGQAVLLSRIDGDVTLRDVSKTDRNTGGLYAHNVVGDVSIYDSTFPGGVDGVKLGTIDGDIRLFNVTADGNLHNLTVHSNGSATTNNVTISGGSFSNAPLLCCNTDGFGIDLSGIDGDVTLTDVAVESNHRTNFRITDDGVANPNNVTITRGSFDASTTGAGIDISSVDGDVTLDDVPISGNNDRGISIADLRGRLRLTRVTADANGAENVYAAGDASDGIDGVTIEGGSFSGTSFRDGVKIARIDGPIDLNGMTASGNSGDGINLQTVRGTVALTDVVSNGNVVANVRVNGSSADGIDSLRIEGGSFNNSQVFYGVHVYRLAGPLILNNVTANGNGAGNVLARGFSHTITGVTITGGSFSNGVEAIQSQGRGIRIDELGGPLTATNVTAVNNEGLNLQASGTPANPITDVTIDGGSFTGGTTEGGIEINHLSGTATLTAVAADGNYGTNLSVNGNSGSVSISGGTFNGSLDGRGLDLQNLSGTVDLTNVTADGNWDTNLYLTGQPTDGVDSLTINGGDFSNSVDSDGIVTRYVDGPVTMNDVSVSGNYLSGIYLIETRGTLSVTNVTADNNGLTNLTALGGATDRLDGATISDSSFSHSGYGYGIDVLYLNGPLDLSHVTADGNYYANLFAQGTLAEPMSGVTVSGGSFSGSINNAGINFNFVAGDLNLSDVTAADNFGDNLDVDITGNVTMTRGSFSRSSNGYGVDVRAVGGDLSLTDVTASDNFRENLHADDVDGNLTISGGTFSGSATNEGININRVAGDLHLTDVTVDNNSADNLDLDDVTGNVAITRGSFSGSANGYGIDVRRVGGNATLTDVAADDNSRENLRADDVDGTLTISGGSFSGSVTNEGININRVGGDLRLTDVTADNNSADDLDVDDVTGSVAIASGSFSGSANGYGIDVRRVGGNVTLTDVTANANPDSNLRADDVDLDVTISGGSFSGSVNSEGINLNRVGGNVSATDVIADGNDDSNLRAAGVDLDVTISGGSFSGSVNSEGINLNRVGGNVSATDVIADGNDDDNLFARDISQDLTISGGSFSGSLDDRGMLLYRFDGDVTIANVTSTGNFDDNLAIWGGSYGNHSGGAVTITGGDFSGSRSRDGVEVYAVDGNVTVNGVVANGNYADNLALFGGYYGGSGTGGDGNVTIEGGSFSNSVTLQGVEIFNFNGDVSISNVTATGNEAENLEINGGCCLLGFTGPAPGTRNITVSDSNFSGSSTDRGVSIYRFDGDVSLTNVTATGNQGHNLAVFGGYYGDHAGRNVTITNSDFSGSTANRGIHLYNVDGDIRLAGVTAENNADENVRVAGGFGGVTGGEGNVVINNGSFAASGDDGLFLYNMNADIALNDVTADDNEGHGLHVRSYGGIPTNKVTIDGGSFSGSTNDSGIWLERVDGDVSLSNVTADGNHEDNVLIDDDFNLYAPDRAAVTGGSFSSSVAGSGMNVEMSGGDMTIDGASFNDNASSGFEVRGPDALTLSNLTTTGNATAGGMIDTVTDVTFNATTSPSTTSDMVVVTNADFTHTRDTAMMDAIQYTAVVNLTIEGGGGGDQLNLESLNAGVNLFLNGGTGNDIIRMADGSNTVNNILAMPTVDGGSGNDRLEIDDSGDPTGTSVVVTETTVDGLTGFAGTPDVTFANIDVLDVTATAGVDDVQANFSVGGTDLDDAIIRGGDDDDTFDIASLSGIRSLTFNGDNGDDIFGNMSGIQASTTVAININGGDPALPAQPGDRLNIDLSNITTAWAVLSTSVGRFSAVGGFGIDWTSIETIDVDGTLIGPNALYVQASGNGDRLVASAASGGRVRVRSHSGHVGDLAAPPGALVVLNGTGGDDQLIASGNLNRSVSAMGGSGNDYLAGGNREDTLLGEAGQDIILGGSGDDSLDGGSGNDQLDGEYGKDTLDGGAGDDFLVGFTGNDTIAGGDGNDEIAGGTGDDLIRGDAGRDNISVVTGNDIILGGDGSDRIYGADGRDILIGSSGVDSLQGNNHDDVLVGGTTDIDNGDSALINLMVEWSGTNDFETRVSNLLLQFNVFDDFDLDGLNGRTGQDLLFQSVGDTVTRPTSEDEVVVI